MCRGNEAVDNYPVSEQRNKTLSNYRTRAAHDVSARLDAPNGAWERTDCLLPRTGNARLASSVEQFRRGGILSYECEECQFIGASKTPTALNRGGELWRHSQLPWLGSTSLALVE